MTAPDQVLHGSAPRDLREQLSIVPPLNIALDVARRFLEEADGADIHSHMQVVQSHASLKQAMRTLLAALEEEGIA